MNVKSNDISNLNEKTASPRWEEVDPSEEMFSRTKKVAPDYFYQTANWFEVRTTFAIFRSLQTTYLISSFTRSISPISTKCSIVATWKTHNSSLYL
jgi:hypothetical protein